MTNQALFRNRIQAGHDLSRLLMLFGGPDTVVLGLPRGGMPVAFEVARALKAPLDVCVVLKLANLAERIVCPHPRNDFVTLGAYYEDFTPTTDEQVQQLLAQVRPARQVPPKAARQSA